MKQTKNPQNETKGEKEPVRVLSRAFSILVHMARERRLLGITEIASAVSLPKATVYRMLDGLERERAVLNRGGAYEIGPIALLLADAYRRQVGFAEVARARLLALRNATKETVHLFVYERGEFYYLDKMESPYQVRMHSQVGAKASLVRLSAGKAVLAHLSEDERRAIGEPVPESVEAEFPEIRAKGYAVDDEQNEPGLRCVGAAILDDRGHPRGAVSVSAPVYRFTAELIGQYGVLVRTAAQDIGGSVLRSETADGRLERGAVNE